MRVLITRYPASEDRLIVRPQLCRRCALRLQPAEPQPYKGEPLACPHAQTGPSGSNDPWNDAIRPLILPPATSVSLSAGGTSLSHGTRW